MRPGGAGGHAGHVRGVHRRGRRAVPGGTRPGRHQAAVLGAPGGAARVRLGAARLRLRLARRRRPVSAGALLDARGGPRAVRVGVAPPRPRRGVVGRRRAGAGGVQPHPRGPGVRGGTADDGRRARRGPAVRGAGLQPCGGGGRRPRPPGRHDAAHLRRRHPDQRRPGRRPRRRRAARHGTPRACLHRRGGRRRGRGGGRGDRVVRAVAGAQRRAQLPARRAGGAPRQGRPDRRGRRRAVRRLRVPAGRRRRGAARRAGAHRRGAAQPQPAAVRPRDDGPRARGARALPRPRGRRAGAVPAGRVEDRLRGADGEAPAADGLPGGAVRRGPVAAQGAVRRRQRCDRRPPRADGRDRLRRRPGRRPRRGERGAAGPADTRGTGLPADVPQVPRGRAPRAGVGRFATA
ncbi:hypothetical protein BH20ACT9_BH20ACT9_06170 [soil metagenome]